MNKYYNIIYNKYIFEVTYADETDPLYLDITSPSFSGSFPTVVYIHGGSLLIGGASSYEGTDAVFSSVTRFFF